MCMYVFYAYACVAWMYVYVPHVCLELELHTVVGHNLGAMNWTGFLQKSSQYSQMLSQVSRSSSWFLEELSVNNSRWQKTLYDYSQDPMFQDLQPCTEGLCNAL